MSKTWNIIKTVLVWLLVALAVFMMVFTIISVSTFNRNDRSLFGYRIYIVNSDSMSKTDSDAGDLIFVKEVDPATLVEGDVISFVSRIQTVMGIPLPIRSAAWQRMLQGIPALSPTVLPRIRMTKPSSPSPMCSVNIRVRSPDWVSSSVSLKQPPVISYAF